MIVVVVIIILSVIAIGLLIWGSIRDKKVQKDNTSFGFVAGIFICFAIALLSGYLDDTPNAMDVYRNKTTLEITYRDSVAIDSTVVFKNKKEK